MYNKKNVFMINQANHARLHFTNAQRTSPYYFLCETALIRSTVVTFLDAFLDDEARTSCSYPYKIYGSYSFGGSRNFLCALP